MPFNLYGGGRVAPQPASYIQASLGFPEQPPRTPNQEMMLLEQKPLSQSDASVSGSAPGRTWVVDCVMTTRMLAVLVSVASIACIAAFQAADIDTDGLFALYDTRVLPYNNCFGPGGAPPPFRDSINTFVANVAAETLVVNVSGETCPEFPDPRSPHGIVWRNRSAVFRYPITVRAEAKRRAFWGHVFAYLRPLPVLWWVYVWSFVFQSYYVVCDYLRGDPVVLRWLRLRCCCLQAHIQGEQGFAFGYKPAPAEKCVYDSACQHQAHKSHWTRLLLAKPAHGAAFLRWVEYACTSPLQLVFFALLMQNTTVDEAILLCNSQLLLCLLGYAVEAELQAAFGHCPAHQLGEHWHAGEANMRQFRAWFLHLSAWYVHGSLWTIIMGEFEDFNTHSKACIEGIDGAPAYVSAILYSQAVFFALFGVVQTAQLFALALKKETRAAKEVDDIFWFAEAGYGVLNVASKFCIAVILVVNIPGMRSTTSGGGACV